MNEITLIEECCYRRLLDFQATAPDRRISTDTEKLRRQCKSMSPGAWVKVWTVIKVKFEPHPDGAGGLINLVLYRILLKRDEFIQERSNSGRLGNEIKHAKRDAERPLSDTEMPRKTHASISIPISKGEFGKEGELKPLAISSPGKVPKYSEAFEVFWLESTRRGSKLQAWKEWKKFGPEPLELLLIHDGMTRWKRSDQWGDETKQPHICNWLKRRGWEEIVPQSSNGNGMHNGFIEKPSLEPHPQHHCGLCDPPHDWQCSDPEICGIAKMSACPELAARYAR